MRNIFTFILLIIIGIIAGYIWALHVKYIRSKDIAIGSHECAFVDTSSPFLLILSKNTPVPDEIISCMHEAHLKGAWLEGIGAVKEIQLAYYDPIEKRYVSMFFNQEPSYELTNFTGNIGLKENQLAPHIHVTLSNNQFEAKGGHLINGKVAVTLEVLIIPLKNIPLRTQLYPNEKDLWLITQVKKKI